MRAAALLRYPFTLLKAFSKKKGMKRIPYAVLDPTFTLEPDAPYTLLIEGAGDSDGFAVKDRAGNVAATVPFLAPSVRNLRAIPTDGGAP